jgi:hypothetical protein
MGRQMRWWPEILLADSFEPMAIWIDDEGRVVGWAIVRPQAWSAVICAAVSNSGGMEVVNGLSAGCNEGQVKTRAWRTGVLGLVDQQQLVLVRARQAVPDGLRAREDSCVAERHHRGVIESRGPSQIGDAEREMAEQSILRSWWKAILGRSDDLRNRIPKRTQIKFYGDF